jgi:hypothetical protein
VKIERAFAMMFGLAVAVEALHWFVFTPPVLHLTFWAGYVILIVLGIMLAREPQPYRTAFANTWPFVLLWFFVEYAAIRTRHGNFPVDWSDEKSRLAEWGWLIASVLHLPLAFAASTLGVALARMFWRRRSHESNAA